MTEFSINTLLARFMVPDGEVWTIEVTLNKGGASGCSPKNPKRNPRQYARRIAPIKITRAISRI
jgi:hypothetical protein